MTLAIATISKHCVWVAADRRLTDAEGRATDDGTKLFRLHVEDAVGIMTYAGVGARLGRDKLEVSEWLSRLLRGRKYTLEGALQIIHGAAVNEELHRRAQGHTFVFAGFRDQKPCIELIANADTVVDLGGALSPVAINKTSSPFHRARIELTNHQRMVSFICGSGQAHVQASTLRGLSKHVQKAGRSQPQAWRIGALLAKIVRDVSPNDRWVSPQAVVAFQQSDHTGSMKSYDNHGRTDGQVEIPTVGGGIDIVALVKLITPQVMEHMERMTELGDSAPALDEEAMKRSLARFDNDPDGTFIKPRK